MSTSRKMRVKLAKHRRSARKATSTEAAREEPEPEPTDRSAAEMPAATQRNSHRPLCTHRNSICLLLPLAVGPKIICRFVHLHISEPTPVWHTEADNARNLSEPPALNVPWEPQQQVGSVKNLAVCLSHSPSEIWPNIHSFFFL